MRLLVIWAESLAKTSGGTTHFLGLMRALAQVGHDVRVVCPLYAGQTLIEAGGLDIRPVRLRQRGAVNFALFQALTILCLPVWLRRHKPQAVYVRACFLAGPMAAIARACGVPLVAEMDSIVDQEILMRGWPRAAAAVSAGLDYVNNRLCSGLVCVTEGIRAEMIRRGARRDRTVAVPNGASTDVFAPGDQAGARAALNLPKGAAVFGFAGSLAPWQGLDLLVSAARCLKGQTDAPFVVAVMGDGAAKAPLLAAVGQADLGERVMLLEAGDHQRVKTFFQACDALVVPIHDPRKLRYGLSVLKFWDGLAAGLPVLVPRGCELGPPLKDLGVPGEYEPGSASDLAGTMGDVMRRLPQLRSRRQEIHQRVAAKYSWDATARRTAEFLDGLVGAGGEVR